MPVRLRAVRRAIRVILISAITGATACAPWIRREVNNRFPPVTPFDRQVEAIAISNQELSKVDSPNYAVTLDAEQLTQLIGSYLVERVKEVTISNPVVRISQQEISIAADVDHTFEKPRARIRGRLVSHGALALSSKGLSIQPTLSRIEITKLDVLEWRAPSAIAKALNAALAGVLTNINGQLAQDPIPLQRAFAQSIDPTELLKSDPSFSDVHGSVIDLSLHIGPSVLLADDSGIHLLGTLAGAAVNGGGAAGPPPADPTNYGKQHASPAEVRRQFDEYANAYRLRQKLVMDGPADAGRSTVDIRRDFFSGYLNSRLANPALSANYALRLPRAPVNQDIIVQAFDFHCGDIPSCSVLEQHAGPLGVPSQICRKVCKIPYLCDLLCDFPCEAARSGFRVVCAGAERAVNFLVAGKWGNVSGDVGGSGAIGAAVDRVEFSPALDAVRMDTRLRGTFRADASFHVTPDGNVAKYILGCRFPWSGSLATNLSIPSTRLSPHGSLTWKTEADGSLALTVKPEKEHVTIETQPSLYEALLLQNPLAFTLSCPVPAFASTLLAALGRGLDVRIKPLYLGAFEQEVALSPMTATLKPSELNYGSHTMRFSAEMRPQTFHLSGALQPRRTP